MTQVHKNRQNNVLQGIGAGGITELQTLCNCIWGRTTGLQTHS